eukprot:scaffold71842_cov33-Tisochrysis_lutea.AAC.5
MERAPTPSSLAVLAASANAGDVPMAHGHAAVTETETSAPGRRTIHIHPPTKCARAIARAGPKHKRTGHHGSHC